MTFLRSIAGDAGTVAFGGACADCLITWGLDPSLAGPLAVGLAAAVRLVYWLWIEGPRRKDPDDPQHP